MKEGGDEFSFNIADTTSLDVVQRGKISALDGSFDTTTENFVVEINDTLKTGNYFLNLYDSGVSAQNTIEPNDFFRLRIVNED